MIVRDILPGMRSQTFRDTLRYSLATVFSTGMGLIRSVALPLLFAPIQMGVWSLMSVTISYGTHAHLGILHGMNKIIPLLRGQKKFEEITVIKNSVFYFNLFLAGLALVIVFVCSFYAPSTYLLYLWVAAGIIFLQLIYSFQFSLLRANSFFSLVSQGVGFFAVCSTVLVVSLAYLLKDRVLGALIGLLVAYLCINLYWFIKSGDRFLLQISVASIRQSFVIGIPISLLGVLEAVFISVDRWIIVANFGVATLGYYALGIAINNLISIVPSSVSSVLYPKMIERFATGRNYSSATNLFLGALRASAIAMLILICGVSYCLPLIIKLLLPKYLPSIPIINVLVLGSFFFSLSYVAGSYLVSVDKQRWLIVVQIASIILLALFYSIALKLGSGIIVLSWITVVGYSALGFSYVYLGVYLVKERKYYETLRFMAGLVIPFVLMVVIVIATESFFIVAGTPLQHLQSSVLSLLFTMCLVLPVAWMLNRDSGLERIIKEEWKLLWKAS